MSINNHSLICLIIFYFIILSSKANSHETDSLQYEVNVSKNLLGTVIEAKAIDKDVLKAKKALYLAFKEIERINSLFSIDSAGSDVYKLNASSGISPVKVSYETILMLKRAVDYSEKYEGYFDVTVGPLTELWGFNHDKEIIVPSKKSIDSLLFLVGYRKIIINELDSCAYLPVKGMKIDFGGIAKGYAVDRASLVMKKFGIENFIINAGGDMYMSGYNASNEEWVVGVKHPRKENDIIAKFHISNVSVATSGDYERFIISGGKRYHHILDPATGMPGDKTQSVTVITSNTEEGTVLAKYIFLIGIEKFKTLEMAKGIKYFVIDYLGNVNYSEKLKLDNGLELIEK